MSITNAAAATLPLQAKAPSRAKVHRPQSFVPDDCISWEDWKKTPTALAIKKWKEENPEEAEEIRQKVLKEMGLA